MVPMQNKLVLWTGKKHSGKTTAAAKLARTARAEGFTVVGLLAPSTYHNGRLIGYDILDLRNKTQASLAQCKTNGSKTERFTFIADGLKLGKDALRPAATESADIIIVDEFGPLELRGDGWRRDVDSLLALSDALILLVVRRELADRVQELYTGTPSQVLPAIEPESIDKIITSLKNRRRCRIC
jgi:nucleoside-triphosphatase THEP1